MKKEVRTVVYDRELRLEANHFEGIAQPFRPEHPGESAGQEYEIVAVMVFSTHSPFPVG